MVKIIKEGEKEYYDKMKRNLSIMNNGRGLWHPYTAIINV